MVGPCVADIHGENPCWWTAKVRFEFEHRCTSIREGKQMCRRAGFFSDVYFNGSVAALLITIDFAAWGHTQRFFSVEICLIEALPIKGCEGFAALFCGVATLPQARHVFDNLHNCMACLSTLSKLDGGSKSGGNSSWPKGVLSQLQPSYCRSSIESLRYDILSFLHCHIEAVRPLR